MNTLSAGKRALEIARTCLRNSPWLTIAVLLHVLLITVFSVIYIAQERELAPDVQMGFVVDVPRPVLEPEVPDVPPLIPRDDIPVFPDAPEADSRQTEDFIDDAAPGLRGERTESTDTSKPPGEYNPDPEAAPDLSSGDPGGTPIGVGGPGHYGLGTSAFSGRRAGKGGVGGGGAGEEGGDGRRRPRTPGQSTDIALEWLKDHQSPDGSWSASGFSARCTKGKCDGAGQSTHDVGVTGLALLCFLGAGHTPAEPGPYGATVREGVKYLMNAQDEDGCFGDRVGQHFLYSHACAALAMAEAYGMTQFRALRDPAQRGVNFVLRAQNPYSAWRYAYPPNGDNDTSVTGWMVMVLKSAAMAGLKTDEQALQNALNWVDEMTDPATGRTGYTEAGGLPSRLSEQMQRFPAERSESMTAVGVLTRVFAKPKGADPLIDKGAELMAQKLPRWDAASGDVDFYYWYYGTLAMFQVGGPRWERWNEALKGAVIEHQRRDPSQCEYGSWDPIDPWSGAGGRVYSTALNCLCMEVYYRYPRVFGTSKK